MSIFWKVKSRCNIAGDKAITNNKRVKDCICQSYFISDQIDGHHLTTNVKSLQEGDAAEADGTSDVSLVFTI